MKKSAVLLFVIMLVFNVAGCSIKPSSGSQNVISPTVILNDTTNYQVESAVIGISNGNWVYGVIKIKYLGTSDLTYVSVNASFKNSQGSELFNDSSYIRNVTVKSSTSYTGNTNTFFTSAYNVGYYCIIENLSDYGIQLKNISKINLQISGDSDTCLAPLGLLSPVGGSTYESSDDSWTLTVTNSGSQTVDSMFTRFIYKDAANKMYMWSFPTCYVGGVIGDVFDIGESGCFTDSYVTPSNLSTKLNFGVTIFDWDVVGASSIKSMLNNIVKNNSISGDQKNQLMRKQIDDLTREKSRTR